MWVGGPTSYRRRGGRPGAGYSSFQGSSTHAHPEADPEGAPGGRPSPDCSGEGSGSPRDLTQVAASAEPESRNLGQDFSYETSKPLSHGAAALGLRPHSWVCRRQEGPHLASDPLGEGSLSPPACPREPPPRVTKVSLRAHPETRPYLPADTSVARDT